MHAFISSWLDYCNVLLTRTRVQEHITPVLQLLHWLPVLFQIDFKVLLFVFKCLNNRGPFYLSDLLLPYQFSRTLKSTHVLVMPLLLAFYSISLVYVLSCLAVLHQFLAPVFLWENCPWSTDGLLSLIMAWMARELCFWCRAFFLPGSVEALFVVLVHGLSQCGRPAKVAFSSSPISVSQGKITVCVGLNVWVCVYEYLWVGACVCVCDCGCNCKKCLFVGVGRLVLSFLSWFTLCKALCATQSE